MPKELIAWPLQLNVRVDDMCLGLIKKAAAKSREKKVSAWARRVLEEAARKELRK